jgi:hypothetical protein
LIQKLRKKFGKYTKPISDTLFLILSTVQKLREGLTCHQNEVAHGAKVKIQQKLEATKTEFNRLEGIKIIQSVADACRLNVSQLAEQIETLRKVYSMPGQHV